MGAIELLLFLKEEKTFVAKYDDISFLNGGRLYLLSGPRLSLFCISGCPANSNCSDSSVRCSFSSIATRVHFMGSR